MGRGFYLFEIILILLFSNTSCKSEKQKTQLQFFYYPDKNVYYDPLKKSFWYSLNGTKSWNTFINANASEPTNLGQKIIINSSDGEVFRENEKHRKMYGGKVFAINTTDTISSKTGVFAEAVERTSVQKKKLTLHNRQINIKSKKSNSIGKFIKKIFGKHK